jgi:hypothetical protein
MTYNMIKTQMFLHQALDYSQIYNFTLDHDYKNKIIIMLKDVGISKSKSIYIYIYIWIFWTYGSILVEYIKVHKEIEMILWTFDKEKKLLKHGEFSWKFCSCNFESIKNYFKNEMIFLEM